MNYLEDYLKTRRQNWPYEDSYRVVPFGEQGFAARIGDVTAGLCWADVNGDSAVMHMNLKSAYAEFGIGTELLHVLMNHLKDQDIKVIRYTISPEHWAFQIYDNLGFTVESRTAEEINFIWKR
ncbi:MAG: GNAT family N-acetyltransferase [Clostridiales bacterium]|nr:GNAT family N-acetyltransferase [Candidatus Crickella merdequi]